MSVDSLATVDDLTNLGIEVTDANLAEMLLASVSSEVRDAAGVPITETTSTASFPTEASRRVQLPGYLARDVKDVLLDGEPLTEGTDYVVRAGSLWRVGAANWHQPGDVPRELTATYTHGYETPPADIVRMVCMYVAAGLNAAADGGFATSRGLQYMSIDDYREGYATGDNEIVDPMELTDRTKAALRARFGGAGPVVYGSVR